MTEKSQKIYLKQKNDRHVKYGNSFVEGILAALIAVGLFVSVQDIMYDRLVLYCTLLAAVLTIVQQVAFRDSKYRKSLDMVFFLVMAGCFLLLISNVLSGFLYTVNRLIILWNQQFGTEGTVYSVSGSLRFGSAIFWILLTVPLTVGILNMMRKKILGGLIAVIIAGMMFGFVVGISSMWVSVICMACTIPGILIYILTPDRVPGFRSTLMMLASVLLFGILIGFTVNYSGSDMITACKENISKQIDSICYGNDTLPRGKLSKASGLLDGDADTLWVEMEEPQALYLRGYVGGVYTGTEWKTISADAYQDEYEGLLDWLEEESFQPVTQYAVYDQLDKASENRTPSYQNVVVRNVGAYRKYVYLPSSAVSWSGGHFEEKKDWQVRSNALLGADQYEFTEITDVSTADEIVIASWLQSPETEAQTRYVNAESVYHYFVTNHYMDVDEDTATIIKNMFFADETEESMDFNTVTAKIRQVLRQETTYTETPPELPEGKDFIKWFLQESKEGNAVHYASAAVMAYRAAGYPARYVEGYHYTDEEAQALIKGDTTEAILTNKNAHAWVEVYVSGAGWMPVEVVPGMYVETYTDQLIEGQPTWQVNSQPEEDGLELEQKGAFGDETEDDQNTSELPSLKKTTAVVLVILYLFLFVFLLLELQRAIRLAIRRKKEKQMDSVLMADICAEKIMRLLKCGGVEGNYNHPFELKQEVVARFPGITERNYERAISLIQKVKFGEMTLMENEKYTLSCFVRRLGDSLYHNRSIFLRMKLRYKILV